MKSFDAPNKSRKIRARAAPHPLAFAYTIGDAQAMGAPGRTTIYKMEQSGELKLLRVAGRTLVDGDSLRRLLGASSTTPGVTNDRAFRQCVLSLNGGCRTRSRKPAAIRIRPRHCPVRKHVFSRH